MNSKSKWIARVVALTGVSFRYYRGVLRTLPWTYLRVGCAWCSKEGRMRDAERLLPKGWGTKLHQGKELLWCGMCEPSGQGCPDCNTEMMFRRLDERGGILVCNRCGYSECG